MLRLKHQPPAKIAVLAVLSLGILFCIAACQEATKLRDLRANVRTAGLLEFPNATPDLGHWLSRESRVSDGAEVATVSRMGTMVP